ncbi:lysozyme inhibitor LprI family protein [Burkholderia sp. 22PA0106]|uniref:lysozyme inhibitor LprI family protein n=1 Tax=Burkholderia sp. 22PA0106 TaxID=3237371 RepID=UPI0039C3CF02
MKFLRALLALTLSTGMAAVQAAPQNVYRMTGVASYTKGIDTPKLSFPVNPATASSLTFDGSSFAYHETGDSCSVTVDKALPYQFDMMMVHAFGTPEKFDAFLTGKFHMSSAVLTRTYLLGQEKVPMCAGLRAAMVYQSPEQFLVVTGSRIYVFQHQTQAPADAAQSFDCSKARSHVEHLICGDPALVKLDATVNRGYVEMQLTNSQEISSQDPVRIDQINWIRTIRNACNDTACLMNAYRARVQTIKGRIASAYPDYPNESTQDSD